MTLITRQSDGQISADTNSLIKASQIAGELFAGEDLDPGALCAIAADSLVYLTDGTAATAAGAVHGIVPRQTNLGEPVTLFGPGVRFRYGVGMTPGAILFSGAGGLLDDAATVGDTVGVAYAVDATDIVLTDYKLVGG